MNYKFTFFLSIFVMLLNFSGFANNLSKIHYGFEENNGQIINQDGLQREDILYVARKPNVKLILKRHSFSYEFYKKKNSEKIIDRLYYGTSVDIDEINNGPAKNPAIHSIHRVDVKLLGGNLEPRVNSISQSKFFNNYHLTKGVNSLKARSYFYDTIVYKDIYDGIDISFYSVSQENRNIFKYDFIIRPGADPGNIKLSYSGAEHIEIDNSNLSIKTSLGIFKESIPYSYTEDGKTIDVRYNIENDIVSFIIGDYDKSKTLIIDPYLIYGSYYGDTETDIGHEIKSDENDDFVIAGYTSSLMNIATDGAHQTELAGDNDAMLIKFNENGERIWASYYGGSGFDSGHTLSLNKDGEIYLAGWTKSITGMATVDAFQYNFSGGEFDSFLAKFDSDGALIWSTYFGGEYDDYINDLIIDGYSNIIFIGRTSSNLKISSPGAYQQDFGGNYDAFLQKFSPDGKRIWGTYFGGSGFDVGMEVCADIFNEIMITGFTQSNDAIAGDGSHKDTLSGIWDAFAAKFSTIGDLLWSTYYGGLDYDYGWAIDSDGDGNIYFAGNTKSSDNIATKGTHKDSLTEYEIDAFIVKLNPDGERIWGSYFGGSDEDYANDGIVDPWNNFLFSGNTFSDNGISTSGAPKTTRSGHFDGLVSKFNPSGTQLWGTYFGGSAEDFGHGLTIDSKMRTIMTGYTKSPSGISTPGAYQEEIGGNTDAYVVIYGDPLPDDTITITNITDSLCAGSLVEIQYETSGTFSVSNTFTVQLSNAGGLFIDFLNIGMLESSGSGTITARLPTNLLNSTDYRIRVVASNPEVVGYDDGSGLSFYDLPKPKISGDFDVCSNGNSLYIANSSSDYNLKWVVSGGEIIGFDDEDTLNVKWMEPGYVSIKLILTNNITDCMDSIDIEIKINPEVIAGEIIGFLEACPGVDLIYHTIHKEGIINYWQITGGNFKSDSIGDSIRVMWNEFSNGLLKLIQVSDTSGCSDSTQISVELFELPKPYILGDSIVEPNSLQLYRTTSSSKYDHFWTVEGGEIIGSDNTNLIEVLWGSAAGASVCLHQTDKQTGCSDSLKLKVNILLNVNEVILGDTVVCSNSHRTYTALDSAYYNSWNVDGGTILGDTLSDSIIVEWGSALSGKVYLYRENKSDGAKDSLILFIDIISSPIFTISGENKVCEKNIVIYNSEPLNGIINNWSVIGGEIIGQDYADSVFINWIFLEKTDSVNYIELYRTDTLSGCSHSYRMYVSVKENPKVKLFGDSIVCAGKNMLYSTTLNNSSDYQWFVSGGDIRANSGDSLITVRWDNSGKGFVQLNITTDNGCIDSTRKEITINSPPTKPVISQIGKTLLSSAEKGNQWFYEGEIIDNANKREFSPTLSGYYNVQVESDNVCLSEMSDPYYFDVNPVDRKVETGSIIINPNPFSDYIDINVSGLNFNSINIILTNILGNKIINQQIRFGYETVFRLNTGMLSPGIYFILINIDGKKNFNKKFIKLNTG